MAQEWMCSQQDSPPRPHRVIQGEHRRLFHPQSLRSGSWPGTESEPNYELIMLLRLIMSHFQGRPIRRTHEAVDCQGSPSPSMHITAHHAHQRSTISNFLKRKRMAEEVKEGGGCEHHRHSSPPHFLSCFLPSSFSTPLSIRRRRASLAATKQGGGKELLLFAT